MMVFMCNVKKLKLVLIIRKSLQSDKHFICIRIGLIMIFLLFLMVRPTTALLCWVIPMLLFADFLFAPSRHSKYIFVP